jgi:N-acetylneuraminate synthase
MSTDKCFVIAEAGVNHNGDPALALELVDAGADAGADAVKFQTFKSDLLVTATAPKADYQVRQTNSEQSQAAMLKALEISDEGFKRLAERCQARGVQFISTPFDEPSVDFLIANLKVETLKVSSGDLTNGPLLLKMARARVQLVVSTGMSTLIEIDEALGVIAFGLLDRELPSRAACSAALASPDGRAKLRQHVTLLHCTSEYPTPLEEVNLRAMDTLGDHYGIPVGYSDHTVGITVPVAAVARGAVMIEKHFTLDRHLPGPDHAASLEPNQFKAMVEGIRGVEKSLGSADKRPTPSELGTARVARRSLHAIRPISTGEVFTTENMGPRRPGTGRSPMDYWDVLGSRAGRNYAAEEMID